MLYAMLFYLSPDDFIERQGPDAPAFWAGFSAYRDALVDAEVLKAGRALDDPQIASTVRMRDGKRLVQDGPYADTKEQLAGFALIEAENLDRALDWAARCPAASTGSVEVRPVSAMPPAAPPLRTSDEVTHVMLIYAYAPGQGPKTQEEGRAVMEAYFAYTKALREAGVHGGGDPLEPSTTATTVRLRGGKRRVQDGPYADTKEELGGYYFFACKSDAEAIEWAARCPAALRGAVEVRPVWRMPQ